MARGTFSGVLSGDWEAVLQRVTDIVAKLDSRLPTDCGGISLVVWRAARLLGIPARRAAGQAMSVSINPKTGAVHPNDAHVTGDNLDWGDEHVWLMVGKRVFDPKMWALRQQSPWAPRYSNYRPYDRASARDLYTDLETVSRHEADELARQAVVLLKSKKG